MASRSPLLLSTSPQYCSCGCLSAIRKIESDQRRPSRQVAELLADTLRIDPGDRAAFVEAARSSWQSGTAALPSAAPAPAGAPHLLETASVPGPAAPLPVLPGPLFGREREVAEIEGLLAGSQCRLLTLIGMGGAGTHLVYSLEYQTAGGMLGAFIAGGNPVDMMKAKKTAEAIIGPEDARCGLQQRETGAHRHRGLQKITTCETAHSQTFRTDDFQ